jgi:hypothetical protein
LLLLLFKANDLQEMGFIREFRILPDDTTNMLILRKMQPAMLILESRFGTEFIMLIPLTAYSNLKTR